MKQAKHTLKKSLESALDIIGDMIPASIGLKSPSVFLEKAEQFLHHKSQQLETFINKKLKHNRSTEQLRKQAREMPILSPHKVKIQTSQDTGLSKEDILKRLAEIDRMILARKLQQEIEHKR